MKYAWIDGQRKEYELVELCSALQVSASGYASWKRGGRPNRKRLTDTQMLTHIRAIHKEVRGAYGSPRMTRELRGRGYPASKERVERLMRENGMQCSMSRKGNCWDNDCSESLFNSLKNERVPCTRYSTQAGARADIFDYIEPFYNRKRLHSMLGFSSPANFLQRWISAQHEQQKVA